MGKESTVDLGPFVDDHPTTAVVELLGIMADRDALLDAIDKDVVSAYLLRVANCDGVPESIRSIARQLYKEWDLDAVSASAAVLLSLGGLLH